MNARNACMLIALFLGALASQGLAQEEPPRRPKADGPPAAFRAPGEEGPRRPRRPPGPGREPGRGPAVGERRPGELPDDVQYLPPGPGFNPGEGRRPPGP